jgi:protein-S-isoprenylcysteine O-methyltransferase Ste14
MRWRYIPLKSVLRSSNFPLITDFLGRIILVAFFGVLATIQAMLIVRMFKGPAGPHWLDVASSCANLAFAFLIVGMTIVRLKPIRRAIGLEPRISAFIGGFLSLTLVALPNDAIGPGLHVAALILILVGWTLSIYVLSWLGRAFSVVAQSRRLVTTGPYAIVRHPLYLCEEIAVIGIALIHFSLAAVVIVCVQWLFQLRRMAHEEVVLRATFPEYVAYAAHTPRILIDVRRCLRMFGRG